MWDAQPYVIYNTNALIEICGHSFCLSSRCSTISNLQCKCNSGGFWQPIRFCPEVLKHVFYKTNASPWASLWGAPPPSPLRQAAPGFISRRLGALSSPLKTPLAFFVKSDPLLLLSHLDLVRTLCRTLCGPCANDRAKMEALFKSCCDARPGPTAGGPPPSPTTQIHRYLHSDGHLGAHWLLADGGGGMKWVVAWLGWWSG
jgi:hypothetical protein